MVHLHLEQRDPIEQGVKSAQRTEPFAEGTVEQHTGDDHRKQHGELPGKEAAQCRPNTGIDGGKGNGALQHALRTEILAEEGVAHADIIDQQRRQQYHHQQQNGIFEVGQGL